ncbi:hypothetical protein FRC03_008452 [Tulasnella sp. 419]|nr:hypothetical protein FRC03_008452 [Tulasnella sp. 419]
MSKNYNGIFSLFSRVLDKRHRLLFPVPPLTLPQSRVRAMWLPDHVSSCSPGSRSILHILRPRMASRWTDCLASPNQMTPAAAGLQDCHSSSWVAAACLGVTSLIT